jgi:tetratricopeptide (TPR) repeat protein
MKWFYAAAVFACAYSNGSAETVTEAAIALYTARHYPEAEAVLEKIVAADPQNAAACYYLGMALRHRNTDHALGDAVVWLEKAVALARDNAAYVADYGETCFLIADQERSPLFATRGRDALKTAIALNPGLLGARASLMEFYARAPWPLGGSSAALAQAVEISQRDSARGLCAYLRLAEIFEKKDDRRAGRTACQGALKLDPNNATAAAALARLSAP